MNEEIKPSEILTGDHKLLDHLATLHHRETADHELQELLESIIQSDLTPKERELFFLRFGEELPFREIARRLGYSSHRTFQLQIATIMKKVRAALERAGIHDIEGSD